MTHSSNLIQRSTYIEILQMFSGTKRKMVNMNYIVHVYYVMTFLHCVQASDNGQNMTFCSGMRIHSFEEHLQLKNCDVIEGNLIFAFKIANSREEWESLGGLKAKEITGYLVLYFVPYLTSLELLLPNLRVIRGQQLFSNYALIINSLMHLKNIGLYNLTSILRGSINIEHNPELSHFVRTINWDGITHWNNGCPTTRPNFIQSGSPLYSVCPKKCQVSGNATRFCWSSSVCQKQKKCPHECLGGCYEEDTKLYCHSCRKFRYYDKCSDSCFPIYEYDDYRCIKDEDCAAMNRKLLQVNETRKICVKECPPFHQVLRNVNINNKLPYCATCPETGCIKECPGGTIDTVEMARNFSGCTKITGSLEIRIFFGKMVLRELMKSLGQVTEVVGYVRVFKTEEIKSLQFFKNLTKVHGDELWRNAFSFVIHDNDNLEELWNVGNKKLKIKNGRVLIFSNPKLCPHYIETLFEEDLWTNSIPDHHIRYVLNGNRKACNVVTNFKYFVIPTKFKGEAQIKFNMNKAKKLRNASNFAGFYIYYRKMLTENFGHVDERLWSRTYIKNNYGSSFELSLPLTNLEPATKYSVYLETRSKNTTKDFQTVIKNFTTNPFNPGVPKGLRVTAKSQKYIQLSWDPPRDSYGEIDHYILNIEPKNFQWHTNIDVCSEEIRNAIKSKEITNQLNMEEVQKVPVELQAKTSEKCSIEPNIGQFGLVRTQKEEREYLSEQLSNLLYHFQHADYRNPKLIRRKRGVLNIAKIERLCGKLSNASTNYKHRTKRQLAIHWGRGGRTNEVDLALMHLRETKYKFEKFVDYPYIKDQLIDLARNLSLYELIPYLEQPNITVACVSQIILIVKKICSRSSLKFAILREIKNCSEILKESKKPQYCYQDIYDNEFTVKGTQYNISTLNHPSYKIKIKACHAPVNSPEICGTFGKSPCKLCSLWYNAYILHDLDEGDSKMYNITAETNGNRVKISWSSLVSSTYRDILGFNIILRDIRYSEKNETRQETRYCYNSSVSETLLKISAGNYSVEISAFSNIRNFHRSLPIRFNIEHVMDEIKVEETYLFLIPVVGFLLLIIIIAGIFIQKIFLQERRNKKIMYKIQTTMNMGYESVNKMKNECYPLWKNHLESKIAPQFIHCRKNLGIMGLIGEGKFGTVSSGTLRVANGVKSVAVKKMKPPSDGDLYHQFYLINEASLMLKIKNYHLVQTYGIVSSDMELFLIMELMHHGSLSKYLKDKKGENIFNIFSEQQVMKLGVQIADGMSYLGHKNILHMDLAARNCLLDGDLNVKVSDFGMSKELEGDYYKFRKKDNFVPIRWMPPEYLNEEKFTVKSDVWSYGIVLWEIVNPGKMPYEKLEAFEDVKFEVSKGKTLLEEIPNSVPSYFVSLLDKCWRFDPKRRPNFCSIVIDHIRYTNDNFIQDFRTKSFHYCRDFEETEDYFSVPCPEEDTRSLIFDNEEDATPNTPLTGSPSLAMSPSRSKRLHSRLAQDKTSFWDKLPLQKWRHILSSFRGTPVSLAASHKSTLPGKENGSVRRGPFKFGNEARYIENPSLSHSDIRNLSKELNIHRNFEHTKCEHNLSSANVLMPNFSHPNLQILNQCLSKSNDFECNICY